MISNENSKKNIESFTRLEPFYFKVPKLNKKREIAIVLILILFSVANPFFLAALAAYVIYIFYEIKAMRSEENIILSQAVEEYKKELYEDSLKDINKVIAINEHNHKAIIIRALNNYHLGNYLEFVKDIDSVKDAKIKNDIDIQLKLGECYENIGDMEKAKEVYNDLLNVFPKSQYLNEKLHK